MVPGRIDAELMAAALLTAALLSSVMAILQYFGVAGTFSPWINVPAAGEAFANLRQRNQFASLITLGLLALIYLAKAPPLRRHLAWLSALLGIGLACSASRTGLAQWLLVLLLLLVWRRRTPPGTLALMGVATGAYVIAVLILPLLLQRWTGVESGGLLQRLTDEVVDCNSRITLWSNVLHLITQRPWTGWGWGELDFAHYVTLYPGQRFCEILDNAHNLPLQLAVELGLPVATLATATALWFIVRARPWAAAAPDQQMAWGCLAIIALHSLLEYPLWYGSFQIATLWCVWHLCRETSVLERDSVFAAGVIPSGWRGSASAIRLACGISGLALLAYAAWDYRRISQIYLVPERRAAAYRTDTLAKISDSVLFRNQVQFAELATTRLSRANSERLYQLSSDLLHFSPEARVIETLIESATLSGHREEALFHLARYRAAFPADHAQWSAALGRAASAASSGN